MRGNPRLHRLPNRVSWWPLGCLSALLCGLLVAGAGTPDPRLGAASFDTARAQEHETDEPHAAGDADRDVEHDGAEHGGDSGAHAEEHGHHDEFDLGHGNASAGLENPASWQFDTALYTAIVFLIVLAVLGKFAWRPIMDGLERRERAIAHTIREAERKLAQASEHLKEYEAKLAAAAAEAKEIVERAHQSAEAAAERIRSEAEEAATRQRERAVAEIGLAKEQALQELAEKVSEAVFGVAGKVLEREVKPQDHSRLVQEALAKLPSEN